MTRTERRAPRGSGNTPPRSVRISDDIWEATKRRAAFDRVTPSYVIATFLEGYSKGLLDLPKVQVTYSDSRIKDGEGTGEGEDVPQTA